MLELDTIDKLVKRSTVRSKHIPMRTCVVCRETRPKREITRLVRTQDHTLMVDPGGTLAGRGAYLCEKIECWQTAASGKLLDKALQVKLSQEDSAMLEQYIADMVKIKSTH